MPIADAKGMAADLTELLLELRSYQERAILAKQDEIIEININGGSFK
jgi:hypothetical protein